jgi:hypothetical protein
MAKPAGKQKLKVFCTPIGFHNAYVAAPSQKAALEAWGVGANLFARGSAEQVTDPALMKEPLGAPGVVFKRLRGTEEEQIAALGQGSAQKLRGEGQRRRAAKARTSAIPSPQRARPPTPSRTELSELEDAQAAMEARQRAELREIEQREQALARQRAALERDHRRQVRDLEPAVQRARRKYQEALEKWRDWKA